MKLLRSDAWLAFGTACLAFACGGSNGGGTGPCSPGAATQLVKNGSDPSWYLNNPLPNPLGVTVKDANNCAVPGVVVHWSITTGGGGLSGAQSTTNSSGVATIVDSIGSASTQVVQAASTGLPSAVFNVTAAAPPTTAAVAIADFSFTPQAVIIKSGGTVTWTWGGAAPHNVTYDGGPAPLPANSLTMTGSGTFPSTISTVGRYTYHCSIHPTQMMGSVTVLH
jgi:plastocyanin